MIDLSDQSPFFQLNDYILFKNTPATITNIIRPEDSFEDDTFVIQNSIGMTKEATVDQIQINNIPRDIVFQTSPTSASLQSTEVSYKSNNNKTNKTNNNNNNNNKNNNNTTTMKHGTIYMTCIFD